MVVGGRFNAPPMASALSRMTDLRIYSSVPPSYWPGAEQCVKVVPHLSILYEKLTKRLPSRQFKDISTQLFSTMTAALMRRDVDVVYAWATFGREAMKVGRNRGAIVLLDRACPHIRFQEELLAEEAEMLGVPFHRSAGSFVERCLEEYSLADLILLPSRYTMRSFIKLGFPESSLRLVSLGPNFEPRKIASQRDQLSFTVGVVAGSLLRKGLRYLIKAWNDLNLPNSKLRLKCSVGELKKSTELWKEIESSSSIEIVGYMKDMEDFYRGCDLFCLPSVDDGFGMVVFEAIACGCPVLVTANVGAADIVQEGETGFIVEPRSVDALAERIQLLYEDRSKLRSMSVKCVKYYQDYKASSFSFDRQVENLVDILKCRSV